MTYKITLCGVAHANMYKFNFQLTAKNIQSMRALLSVAHCHGGILGTAWHLVLTTLQVWYCIDLAIRLGFDLSSNTGHGCSKLTTSLVNILLKFQTLMSNIRQYFCWKNERSFCTAKASLIFFNKKCQCIWLQRSKTLNKLTYYQTHEANDSLNKWVQL